MSELYKLQTTWRKIVQPLCNECLQFITCQFIKCQFVNIITNYEPAILFEQNN